MNGTTETIARQIAANDNRFGTNDSNLIVAAGQYSHGTIQTALCDLIVAGLARRVESRTVAGLAHYTLTAAGLDALDALDADNAARRAAKIAATDNAADWTGPFCPLCALSNNNRCEC
jgi:DNA-binding HxlR family transcriptional regulator